MITGLIREKKILLCVLLGISLAACLNILIVCLSVDRLFPAYSTSVKPFLFRLPLYLGVLVYGLASPVLEELIFRWLFFRRLCIYVTAPAAGAASAVIFGLYHGNAVQFIYAFIFGLVLAYVCWRFDSLLPPVLVHSAANIYVYVLYFLPPVPVLNTLAARIIIIFVTGLVSFCILLYFLKTASERSISPEKPFFPGSAG